jgi:hypothetical protein
MGVPLKTENEENPGVACKRPVAKAGGESSEALRKPILHGLTPASLRPPPRLPNAEHGGVASSLFSFERDPHAWDRRS